MPAWLHRRMGSGGWCARRAAGGTDVAPAGQAEHSAGTPDRPGTSTGSPVKEIRLESAGEALGVLEVRPRGAAPAPEAQQALEILVQHLVSVRRRREATEAAMRFRALAETTAEGILLADPVGRIVYCNPAAARMFGYDPNGLVGRVVSVILPGPHDETGRWERAAGCRWRGRRARSTALPVASLPTSCGTLRSEGNWRRRCCTWRTTIWSPAC
ncbi:hypothetical protein caldi_14160 [Caldinitratiruptor microaerophilus]|uniref:PAS domain-containing protein n=1 Tax=Caldinitratiruptor microaerophilus TaxID=671077 RepID=A0AA35CMY9_9FIRM|nr:hypothetical protein caldi_14160 [Caldinitratiruptor microaerophilus]